ERAAVRGLCEMRLADDTGDTVSERVVRRGLHVDALHHTAAVDRDRQLDRPLDLEFLATRDHRGPHDVDPGLDLWLLEVLAGARHELLAARLEPRATRPRVLGAHARDLVAAIRGDRQGSIDR